MGAQPITPDTAGHWEAAAGEGRSQCPTCDDVRDQLLARDPRLLRLRVAGVELAAGARVRARCTPSPGSTRRPTRQPSSRTSRSSSSTAPGASRCGSRAGSSASTRTACVCDLPVEAEFDADRRGRRRPLLEAPAVTRLSRPTSVLAGIKVLELSNGLAGVQAGQFLADFGADVVQVEPPGGSPLRALPAWAFWARGKRSIELDLHRAGRSNRGPPAGGGQRRRHRDLPARRGDRLRDSATRSWPGANPGLVYVSVTRVRQRPARLPVCRATKRS